MLRSLVSSLALSLCALGTALAADAPKPAVAESPAKLGESRIVCDFRNAQSFTYGSWKDLVGPTKDGILIQKAPDGKGGCCGDVAMNLEDAQWLELGLATLPLNELPSLQLILEDTDGTNVSVRYNISQLVPGSPVWLRVKLAEARVTKPGANGSLDLAKVNKWHVQGDWATEKPVQLIVIALRARR